MDTTRLDDIKHAPSSNNPPLAHLSKHAQVSVNRCHDFIRRYIHWKPGRPYSASDHVVPFLRRLGFSS